MRSYYHNPSSKSIQYFYDAPCDCRRFVNVPLGSTLCLHMQILAFKFTQPSASQVVLATTWLHHKHTIQIYKVCLSLAELAQAQLVEYSPGRVTAQPPRPAAGAGWLRKPQLRGGRGSSARAAVQLVTTTYLGSRPHTIVTPTQSRPASHALSHSYSALHSNIKFYIGEINTFAAMLPCSMLFVFSKMFSELRL